MELIDSAEAASILKVSRSTISRMRRTGDLPCVIVGRKIRFPRSTVMQVKRERSRGHKIKDLKSEVVKQRYDLMRHERMLNMILMRLGIENIRKVFSDKDLVDLYNKAEKLPERVTLEAANAWVEQVVLIYEIDYARMANLTGDPYPWRRFHRYTEKMIATLQRRRDYPDDPEGFKAVSELHVALQEIRKCGVVMLRTQPVPSTERFNNLVSDPMLGEVDPEDMIRSMGHHADAPSKADIEKFQRIIKGSTDEE